MEKMIIIICNALAIFFTVTIFEYIKALISTILGDPLPKNEKRLTLNPFKHFEPIGYVLLWAYNVGWGKPVRTSSMYYKNKKRDTIIVHLSPIIMCLILAFIFYAISFAFFAENISIQVFAILFTFFYRVSQYFVALSICNLLPINPFCGEKILSALLPVEKTMKFIQMQNILQVILLMLLFFGILNPIVSYIISFVFNIFNSFLFFI